MVEFLKHLTGACGEPHPSLLTLVMGAPAVGYVVYKVKNIFKNNEEQ
jgi:hypothetical protein|tara:strand:- start:967 stop:1107 length:141 start_codon:yes stop_codon:yes gene_type:complete